MLNNDQTLTQGRLPSFDQLRYWIILLVVVYHSCISYCNVVPWWYVIDPKPSIVFDVFEAICDTFMMPTLFLVSGYFALPSLQNRGVFSFLKNKIIRLGVPLVLGSVFLAPIVSYIRLYTKSIEKADEGFWVFWLLYMKDAGEFTVRFIDRDNNPYQFSHSHFWFLSLLLVFFFVFCLIYKCKEMLFDSKNSNVKQRTVTNRSISVILLIVGFVTSMGYFITNLYLDDFNFILIASILEIRGPSLVLYICYFTLGIYAFSRKWFENEMVPFNLFAWTAITIVLSLCYLYVGNELIKTDLPSVGLVFAFAFVRSYLCLAFIVVLIWFVFRKRENPGFFNSRFTENSYYIYLIHLVIVITFQFILTRIDIPAVLKFTIVAFLSLLFSFLISHYVIKPFKRLSIFGLAFMFAIMVLFV